MRTTLLIGGLWLGAAGTASAQTFSQVTFEYDEVGRLLRERGADGRVVAAHAYDLVGNRTSTTDALGHTTRYVHDALDRVVEVEDALGGRTRLSYDGNDRLTQVVDPRGLTTRYVVDGHGRTLREISPDRGETTYTHNADGQLARMKRANGTWLDYTYDSAGRVKTEGNGTEVRQFTYDTCQNGKGRFCSVTVNGNSTTVTYAPHGELATRADRTEGQTATTHYFHDKAGRMTGLQYPDGMHIDQRYEGGELREIHAQIGSTLVPVATAIRHAPFGGVEGWTYGNGLVRTVNRDADGRVTGIGASHATGARQSLTYQHDAASRITRITNGIDGALSQTYGYDPLSRLTSAASTARSSTFGHDANANRIAHTEGGANLPLVVAADSNRLIESGIWRYVYDAAGNRVWKDDGWDYVEYEYDAFQRLKRVDVAEGWMTYITHMETNGLDQRVHKTSSLGTTRFVYLGQNQLFAEQGSAGWKRYVWLGDTLVGVVTPQNAVHYVHTDHLGRPEATTNTARAYTWRAANHAFDRTVTLDQIGGLEIGFPGQYHDAETGLSFNGFRYYDRERGAYTQVDPLGLRGGLNPYVYVGANPIAYIDPFGLWCIGADAKNAITGAAGAIAGTAATGNVHPAALIGMGIIGAGAGYYLGDMGSGAVGGAVAGGAATRSGSGALVGAAMGALGGVESNALVAGTMGAIEGAANAPRTRFSATHWSATVGPALKGIKGGVAGWAGSEFAGAVVDAVNDKFGDCDCGQ